MQLHLGCGDIRLAGWVNVDVRKTAATDMVEDVATLPSFSENSVDAIYACHVLEHFGFGVATPNSEAALRRWVRLLKPGGRLLISVPDLVKITQGLQTVRDPYQQFDFVKATYGGCDYPENRHFIGFSKDILGHLMLAAGLTEISHFDPFAEDTSKFVLHGVPVSLNMTGVKQVAPLTIVTAFVNAPSSKRLADAQMGFLRGVTRFAIEPVLVTTDERPKFGDLLHLARKHTRSGWMLWCNSDCELLVDPRIFLEKNDICYGFHRREDPTGEICGGVDMYAIPVSLWDDVLSKDIPDMYVGATHIDWWISRSCQNVGKYKSVRAGVLNHPSHEQSGAGSAQGNDPISRHNIDSFNAWADRQGVNKGLEL